MSTMPIAVPASRLRAPIVTALLVAAFAVGTLTGSNLPSAFGGGLSPGGEGTVAQSHNFTGVAVNNMSDAALRARYGSPVQPHYFPGVAVNNMSDAALRARYCSPVGGAIVTSAGPSGCTSYSAEFPDC